MAALSAIAVLVSLLANVLARRDVVKSDAYDIIPVPSDLLDPKTTAQSEEAIAAFEDQLSSAMGSLPPPVTTTTRMKFPSREGGVANSWPGVQGAPLLVPFGSRVPSCMKKSINL